MRRWIGQLLAVSLLQGGAATALADKDRFEVGEEVKTFTLKVVNTEDVGEPYISIERYYGPEAKEPKKAVILSFFATYCEPCKREMPYLAALHNLYKDKGLAVLSISIDREPEQIEFVKNLARDSNVSFPVLSDRFNIVAKRFYIAKLPCVYLVNGEGKVSLVSVGYSDDISKSLLEGVRKAVGEPSTDPVPEVLVKYMTDLKGAAAIDVRADIPEAPAVVPADAAGSGEAGPAAESTKAKAKPKPKGKPKGKDRGKVRPKGKKKGK